MRAELPWGRHYLMVPPDEYHISWAINPYMDPTDQPDDVLARSQWNALREAIEAAGGTVSQCQPGTGLADMTYAMNLGLPYRQNVADPGCVVMSHMRWPVRRPETDLAATWFSQAGSRTQWVGGDGNGPFFEAGDAFAFGDALLVGTGPRTHPDALALLADHLDVRVRGYRLAHPAMYHFDLAFSPLDTETAILCPTALHPADAADLLERIPNPIVITDEEAIDGFVANSITVGSTVLMPTCPDHVRDQLTSDGFTVEIVDVSQFHKGGGSIRCLTNPLDLVLTATDLHPGAEVLWVP